MKFYEVVLTYTATTSIYVEAENEKQAESLAWEEIESDGSYGSYGHWDLENITEETKETNHA